MSVHGMTLRELIHRSGKIAKEKGWWDDRSVGDFIALCHSELSEALEYARMGKKVSDVWIEDLKPEGVIVELADVYIRIADYIAQHGLAGEFERAISAKLVYNSTRPRRHGKEF